MAKFFIFMFVLPGIAGFAVAQAWIGIGSKEGRAVAPRPVAPPILNPPEKIDQKERSAEQKVLAAIISESDDAYSIFNQLLAEGDSIDRLANALFELDPEKTLEFIDGIEDRAGAFAIAEQILVHFPASKFPMLRDWNQRQSPGLFRNRTLGLLLPFWESVDLEGAVAAVALVGDTPEAGKVRMEFLAQLGINQQLAVLKTMPAADQVYFLTHGVELIVRRAPERALAAIEVLPDESARATVLENILNEWVNGKRSLAPGFDHVRRPPDPRGAVAAAADLEDPTLKALAYEKIAYSWSSVNSALASEWAAALPPGSLLDAAAKGLADELSSVQPDMAFEWGAEIGNRDLRSDVLRGILADWRGKDHAAAQKAVEDSALSAKEKTELLVVLREADG